MAQALTKSSAMGLSASAKRLTLAATILGSSIAVLDGSVVSVALHRSSAASAVGWQVSSG